ncbi:MAG: 50S ribosomal protein L29 [Bacteroidetes bacterium 47-18]|nr:MAG: 50S ribosomal protein L29 [Bacteroidetes bacterium 47-18]
MANSNKNKGEQISSLSVEQLKDQINEQSENLKRMKFSHSINPIENPMTIRSVRRQIARLKTELTQKSK